MQRLPPRSTRTDTLFPARLSSVLRKINPPCFGKVAVAGHLAKRPVPATGRPVPVARGFRDKTPEKEGNSMVPRYARPAMTAIRSEEHTSELQSLMRISNAVFCLNKKKTIVSHNTTAHIINR